MGQIWHSLSQTNVLLKSLGTLPGILWDCRQWYLKEVSTVTWFDLSNFIFFFRGRSLIKAVLSSLELSLMKLPGKRFEITHLMFSHLHASIPSHFYSLFSVWRQTLREMPFILLFLFKVRLHSLGFWKEKLWQLAISYNGLSASDMMKERIQLTFWLYNTNKNLLGGRGGFKPPLHVQTYTCILSLCDW